MNTFNVIVYRDPIMDDKTAAEVYRKIAAGFGAEDHDDLMRYDIEFYDYDNKLIKALKYTGGHSGVCHITNMAFANGAAKVVQKRHITDEEARLMKLFERRKKDQNK